MDTFHLGIKTPITRETRDEVQKLINSFKKRHEAGDFGFCTYEEMPFLGEDTFKVNRAHRDTMMNPPEDVDASYLGYCSYFLDEELDLVFYFNSFLVMRDGKYDKTTSCTVEPIHIDGRLSYGCLPLSYRQ